MVVSFLPWYISSSGSQSLNFYPPRGILCMYKEMSVCFIFFWFLPTNNKFTVLNLNSILFIYFMYYYTPLGSDLELPHFFVAIFGCTII